MQWKSLLTDRQIVARVLSGRTDDFEVLVQRHLPMAQAVAYAQLGQRSEAEDVVQEGFLKAYTGLDGLQQPERFRSWLATIVRNLAVTVLRKETREVKALPALAQADATHPYPEIERRDLLSLLEGEIEQLDEPYREVLLMHYFSGMKVREVADALDVSKEVAAKRLQRGRKALSERVLGVLDTVARAKQPERSTRTKTIMGLVAATPVAWRSTAASAGVATVMTPFAVKTGIISVVAASALAALLLFHRPASTVSSVLESTNPAIATRLASSESVPDGTRSLAPESSATALPESGPGTRPTGIGVVTGAVLNPDGAPLAQATVRVEIVDHQNSGENRKHYRYEAITDATGRFRIENLPLDIAWVTGGIASQLAGTRTVGLSEDFPEWFVWIETEKAARVVGRVVDESGRPVADATLTPRAWNSDDISGWDMQALETPETTDTNGQFSFEWLRPGTWTFEVAAPGYAPRMSDDIPSGTTGASIVLSEGGSLSGTAIAADTGQPVAGAIVRLYPAGPFFRKTSAETAADGTFRFDRLAPEKYAIVFADTADAAAGGGYYLAERLPPFEVREGQNIPGLQLVLEPGAAVSGVVVGADGLPCSDCTVVVKKDSGSDEARTDEEGRYRIAGLVPGDRIVTVHPRYPGSERSVALEAGKTRDGVDFRYPEGAATITGVVTDGVGNPLPGVEVTALDQYWHSESATARTGEDGAFRIDHVPPADMLWLRPKKPGWVGQDIMTRLTERGIDGVTMTMTKPATILGKAVDDAGLPVENVTIWHRGVDISVLTTTSSKTTKGGRFAFARLVPGDYRLLAEREGSPEVELGHVHVEPGEVRDDVTLILPETSGLEIAGTVVDASRNPIPGVLLNVYPQSRSGDGIHTTTDRFGRFVFSGLQGGSYRLLARGHRYGTTEMKNIEAGRRDLEVQLLETGSIEGRVLATGTADPVKEFFAIALDGDRTLLRDDDRRLATLVSNDSGAYTLADVKAGTHTVAAWAEGYAPDLQTVEVLPGQTVPNVVLWLAPDRSDGPHDVSTTTLRGRVVDSAGKPVEDALLFLNRLPMGHERLGMTVGRSDINGNFVIENVPSDTKHLIATHDGHAPGVTNLTGSVDDVTVMVPDAGTISGTVRLGGEPLSMQSVVVRCDVDIAGHTNAEGAYTISGVPEGLARVSVWLAQPTMRRNYSQEVLVTAGETATANIDIVLGSADLVGTLLINGEPTRGTVMVDLTTPDGSTNHFAAYPDDTGVFRLTQLPEATVQIGGIARANDQECTANETIALGAGELRKLELDLTPEEN